MTKNFQQLTDKIEKAVASFTKSRKSHSVLCIMCSKSEWRALVSGTCSDLSEKEREEHDRRIITALVSNRKLCEYVYSIAYPAYRYFQRQDKKKRKQLNNDPL